MTPIGHLSVSYITGRSLRKLSLPAVMIGGVLPDFDFLFLFFDWFNNVHRVISHNLFVLFMASLLLSLAVPAGRRLAVGLSLFLGGMLHLFIDSCMDINPTNGIGIAVLWPFRGETWSPFNILQSPGSVPGWSEPVEMIKLLIPALVFEIPFYIISLILVVRAKPGARILQALERS